jgi:ABC-type proline/glycine betaine transport system permease subunit
MVEVPAPLPRRLLAEGLGTALLVATVVGSGIMAERLAGGNQAIALLGNTIPTGAILVVIIAIFGPVSGAHFNPAVSLVFAARGEMPWRELMPYVAVQCARRPFQGSSFLRQSANDEKPATRHRQSRRVNSSVSIFGSTNDGMEPHLRWRSSRFRSRPLDRTLDHLNAVMRQAVEESVRQI